MNYPDKILHWIDDKETGSLNEAYFDKYNPANGQVLTKVTRGSKEDVYSAISISKKAFSKWSDMNIIARSDILRKAANLMNERKDEIAEIIALEAGRPKNQALGEVDGAVACGLFIAGEGRRYYGQTLETSTINRSVSMIRDSIGVGALIIPFNTPIASVAWKTFPALLCGNSVVLKSHEYTPYTAVWFAKILKEAGLPSGVFSVLQGLGTEVGAPIVENKDIQYISFTGSSATGASIVKSSASRLAKVSIEAGGKNPIVVCDDADLEKAVSVAVSSAFVDAGQRCATASRLIIFDAVYEKFKEIFLSKVRDLKVGEKDDDDYGAIISEKRLIEILDNVNGAVSRGAKILTGGKKIDRDGYFLEPIVLESISPDDEISGKEIFGPVVILYRAKDFDHAVLLANNCKYKLSGAIHTKNIDRAQEFIKRYRAGVVRVNGPTYGSEPHMPFGGPGFSGNGWREPGLKALDFYSEWKQVSIDHDPLKV